MNQQMIAFGPIPSRRLGRSLGINNIPPKNCSYSCVYCQLGKAMKMDIHRDSFFEPSYILERVREKIREAKRNGESIDYLSFVPDGEPTLDINLGETIALLKPLGYPVAVITNGSLLWRNDVRKELKEVDWLSLKVDSVTPSVWKRLDRPYKSLELPRILEGMKIFSKTFRGTLTTETMVVKDYNDSLEEMNLVADFVAGLHPGRAYLSVPTRPPAVKTVVPPDEAFLTAAFQLFREKIHDVELLCGHEGGAFAYTGDAARDILGITSVHPIREEALKNLLQKAGEKWNLVEELISADKLKKTEYQGTTFYIRKFN